MNKFILCVLLIFLSGTIVGQNEILDKMQGLSLNGDMVFSIDGYMMTIQKEKGSLNKNGKDKIKKKYKLNNIVSEYSDKSIKWENWVIENKTTVKSLPDIEGYQKFYLIPQSDDRMMLVTLQSPNGRDTILENAFMNAVFSRKLAQYTTDNWVAEKIDFAGREIVLGDVCQWVSPHNVHCASLGQMSWSIFKTEREAVLNTEIQMSNNNNSGRYKIIKEDNIDLLFEGIPTKAERITYKINTSKLLSGGRNTIAVYYITQKVRNQYLSCVLTQYIEVKNDYSPPMLLKEVISLSK